MNNFYTVWVGGAEVTDFYVSLDTATAIKNEYESKGYDDVIIEKVNKPSPNAEHWARLRRDYPAIEPTN